MGGSDYRCYWDDWKFPVLVEKGKDWEPVYKSTEETDQQATHTHTQGGNLIGTVNMISEPG